MLKIFLEQAAAEDQYPLPAPRQRRHPTRIASASTTKADWYTKRKTAQRKMARAVACTSAYTIVSGLGFGRAVLQSACCIIGR